MNLKGFAKDKMVSPYLVNKMITNGNCQDDLDACGQDGDFIRSKIRIFMSFAVQTTVNESNLDKLTRLSLSSPGLLNENALAAKEDLLNQRKLEEASQIEEIVMASGLLLREKNANIPTLLYSWTATLYSSALRGDVPRNGYTLKRLKKTEKPGIARYGRKAQNKM